MEASFSERLLSQPEVQAMTRLSASKLEKDRVIGSGIPFVKIGRAVRYRLSDVQRFLSELPTFKSTTEARTH